MRSIRFLSLVVFFVSVAGMSQADAAIFSGIIKSISENQKQVVITSAQGKEKSFSIPDSIPTTINSKPAKIDQLKVGQRATVFTSASGAITRFSVRDAAEPKSSDKVSRPKKEMKTKKGPEPASEDTVSQGWTQFRGPGRANISTETGLLKDWNQSPPKLLWTARGLGEICYLPWAQRGTRKSLSPLMSIRGKLSGLRPMARYLKMDRETDLDQRRPSMVKCSTLWEQTGISPV